MISIFILLKLISSESVCYPPLGCFSNEPPWSVPGYRPKLLPWSIEDTNPQFYLTTENAKDEDINWLDVDNTEFSKPGANMKEVIVRV